jgi:cyanate permease
MSRASVVKEDVQEKKIRRIGNYKLKYPDRKREDWRRQVLLHGGIAVNIVAAGMYSFSMLREAQGYSLAAALGLPALISMCLCLCLFLIRNSTLKESALVAALIKGFNEYILPVVIPCLIFFLFIAGFKFHHFVYLAVIISIPFVFDAYLQRHKPT